MRNILDLWINSPDCSQSLFTWRELGRVSINGFWLQRIYAVAESAYREEWRNATVQGTPLRDAIAPLCRFLRISKVTSAVFDNDAYSANISRETYSYYDDGGADDRFISFNEHISRHGTAVYSFFQRSGEESWSDEEKAQIRAFEKHLFVLSERAFTIQLAESLPLHDSEFEVYSLPFFLTTSRTLIAQGNVGEFGAVYFNIRGFSAINQNLGRETSNKVLSLFVKELVDKLVYEECVCRIGSDNFVMLFRKENHDM